MKVQHTCPTKGDNVIKIIFIVQLFLSCIIILFLHWILSIAFSIFWILSHKLITNKIICVKCIYNLGNRFETIENYEAQYKKIFNRSCKIITLYLMGEWSFSIVIGIITLVISYSLIKILVITLMIFQIYTIFYFNFRVMKYHCPRCLARNGYPYSRI